MPATQTHGSELNAMRHIDLSDGHPVVETDSIEGSVVFEDLATTNSSPCLPHRNARGATSQRSGMEELLRTQDVVAMSTVVSTLQNMIDDFIGSVKELCQRHAVPFSNAKSSSAASDLPMLCEAFRSQQRFSKNEPLLDLAAQVDTFFEQSAVLREAAKRITQRLTNRHVGTQSFAHLGNSRFTCTYLNLANAMNATPPNSLMHSAAASPSRMSMQRMKPQDQVQVGSHASPSSGAFLPRGSVGHPRRDTGTKQVSVKSPEASGDFELAFPVLTNKGSTLSAIALRRGESISSLQSLTTCSVNHATHTETVDVSRDTEGNKLINSYIVIGELGRGSFGKVKLAEHKQTKELFAIKVLNKSMLRKVRNGLSSGIQQVQTEIAVMKKLRHRNIVNLYEVIDDPKSNKMYLVMQYVDQGTVLTIHTNGTCSPLDDKTTREYARQLAAGLNYLHRHNVIHRDIKPDNILLGTRNGTTNLFLSDFGVSEILDDDSDEINGSQGTPAFMSPELCRGEGSVHGKAVDMWALGVTLYAFLCGKLPFYGSSVDEISHKVQNVAVVFPPDLDEEWVELLSALLNKDPNKRMTASELRQSPVLFGKGDAMAHRRRASAIDVVLVDEEDIENAIAVGNQVHFCCHRTPREKVHEFVLTVRNRVRYKQAKEREEAQAQHPATPLEVVALAIDPVESVPLSPHPPSPARGSLHGQTSPPQRPMTREGSEAMHSPGRLLAAPEFDTPRGPTGAKLRGGWASSGGTTPTSTATATATATTWGEPHPS